MRKPAALLFFLACLFFLPAQVKKIKDPFEKKLEVLETAQRYRFPQYYAKKSVFYYSFELYRYSDPPQLEVNESVSFDLTGAEANSAFRNVIFYDDQSSIKSVTVKDEAGEELPVEVLYGNYQSENIFHDDLKLGVFEVPLETPGTERRIEYKKKYRDYKYLQRIWFNNDFPSEETEIRIEVPVWLNVEFMKFNFDQLDITERTEKKSSLDGQEEYTTYIFTAKHVDQFRNEKNAPSAESVYPHLFIIFKSFKDEGKEVSLLKNMQGLYDWCSGLCKKVENDTAQLRQTVDSLVKGKKTDEEKIESVFFWVQDKIRYIAFEEGIMGYKPMSADKVYTRLYGDCKGMANLLKNMLRMAGFDARLTWIGTRDIPYRELYPVLGIFNHMICCVFLNGKKYFLDGTENFIALNENAWRLQGKTVMIENGDNFITDIIPVADHKNNLQRSDIVMRVEGNKLKGIKTTVYNGEEKLNFLSGYSGIKTEDKEKAVRNYLTYNDKNIKISSLKHSDLEDRKNPVRVSYGFETDNYVFQAGTDLYVYIDFDKEFEKYQFDSLRFHDWEMDHRVFISSATTLDIPAGYELKAPLPGYSAQGPDYTIDIKFAVDGNKIVYTRSYIFNNAIIRKKDFSNWNKVNAQLRKIYNTPVIFKKKNAS